MSYVKIEGEELIKRSKAFGLSGHRAIIATLLGAALTATCAQLSFHLPGNPVPVTLQVFAVSLCGMVLGGWLAAVSQLEYLTAGLLGLPVFASFKCGPGALTGPTGGYLIAFVPAAFITGVLASRFRNSLCGLALSGLTGVVVIYLIGRAWLALWLGNLTSPESWVLGVLPFVATDVVKVWCAALISRRLS